MKYAVIKTGGKQYKVSEGQILEIESQGKKPKDKLQFEEVLLLVDNGVRKLGKPFIPGVKVEAEVLEETRGPKIRVAKYKSKVRYRKVIGFRQSLTRIKIENVGEVNHEKIEEKPEKTPRKTRAKA